MRSKLGRAIVLVLLLVLVVGPLQAAPASISIDSAAGRKNIDGVIPGNLKGRVLVQGVALPSTPEETQPGPLVADAGDSPFVAAGTPAVLLGAGFGGVEPYSFAWSSAAGPIDGADAPTAQLDTSSLAPGTYDVNLTITDAAGASASDSVRVVVYERAVQRVLDETWLDATPGYQSTGPSGTFEFPVEVAPGTTLLEAVLSYEVATNDYDLRLLDPSRAQRAFGAQFVGVNSESVRVANPEPGSWLLVVEKFVTAGDQLHLVADTTAPVGGDPRPAVSAGGPYGFAIGAAQQLSGSVSGGTAPVQAAWDSDGDGVFESAGAEVSLDLAPGRHLVTLKASDAAGLERRQTTSLTIADPAELAARSTPLTVVAINDTGINPYHLEFSAQTYPDPEVLALTRNFTRHPSEYISGYPADTPALQLTLGQGYYPAADKPAWNAATINQLYWIPGTKIIGAIDPNAAVGGGTDAVSILDENGHGTGSASVSVGNRYGYCPTCLLVVVEGLTVMPAATYSWVDITSHSWGARAGVPFWSTLAFPSRDMNTQRAAERGQMTLFAAGNGLGNAFDVPQITYLSDNNGNDWNVVVGAIRRDSQRAIVGDGLPVHLSSWGDGNLPSGCRTGTVSQCAFSGTSAATPYTAGVFGSVLTEVRRQLGDPAVGQRPGQVIAEGLRIPGSTYLADGRLTRAELREVVLKTAEPLNQQNQPSPFPYPLTAPYTPETNVLFEGYGAATPNSIKRALDVLFGRAELPERSFEDAFFAIDRRIRDTIYGGFDRDGDGVQDSAADDELALTPEQMLDVDGLLQVLALAAERQAQADAEAAPQAQASATALTYFLHRRFVAEPGLTPACGGNNETYMDAQDTTGDIEPCYENRVTSVAAAYRPIGMFPATAPLTAPLPAGSTVTVELYIAHENPAVIQPTGVLVATDREIGKGAASPRPVVGSGSGPGSNVQGTPLPDSGGCATLGEACWTRFDFSFTTTRPAFTGEQLTFQLQLVGSRAWSFGYEAGHRSKIQIAPAAMPATGLDFGVVVDEPAQGASLSEGPLQASGRATFPELGSDPTGAGDHPTQRRVELSLNDASFSAPVKAVLDEASGAWYAPLGNLAPGSYTLYARAAIDRTTSTVTAHQFVVEPLTTRVEWQVVPDGGSPAANGWRPASGLPSYAFEINTAQFPDGAYRIHVRLVEGNQETARSSVLATFKNR